MAERSSHKAEVRGSNPELTDQQRQIIKSGKKITKMTLDQLIEMLDICRNNVVFWKNRRSVRKSWEEKVIEVEKEISNRSCN